MIKIKIDKPTLPAGPLEHSGTSWQISRIPDFSNTDYHIVESLNDLVNKESFTYDIDLDNNESIYCRIKYHFNDGNISSWSKTIPVTSGQIGMKLSGDIVLTPKVKATLLHNGSSYSNLLLETNHFEMFSGVGDHLSTSWYICDIGNNVIWSRENELIDKLSIEIDSKVLEPNKAYVVKAVHKTNTNASSNPGKAILDTNVTDNVLFAVEAMDKLVPGRDMYFKLHTYIDEFVSIDIIIRDIYGNDIISNIDQVTKTPRVSTDGLSLHQRYEIVGRIKYSENVYSEYKLITSAITEIDYDYSIDLNKTYLDEYNFTQEVQFQGEVVQSTKELYTNDILIAKHASDSLHRQIVCGGMLIDKGPVLTLDGIKNILGKPYVNIVPLRNGKVLIDYNAIRAIDIDSDMTPENVREYMNSNNIDNYDHNELTVIRDNDYIKEADRYRPRFSLYDFNIVTNVFTLLDSVIRDDELYGTGVTNSLVVVGDMVYYIPTQKAKGILDHTLTKLTLMKLDLTDMSVTLESNLPVSIKSYPTLFMKDNDTLVFTSGSQEPIIVDHQFMYNRSNDDIYEYTISTGEWDTIGLLPGTLPNTISALSSNIRKDGKVVLFNNTNYGPSRGDQRSLVMDLTDNTIVINDNDTPDDMTYRNSIQLLNGDILRVSTRVSDPQLVYTYVSDTYVIEDIVEDTIIDIIRDLVIPIGETVYTETLYKYDSIIIHGDAVDNTGKLVLIDDVEGNIEFLWNDLIVIGDMVKVQELYLPDIEKYNTITALENSSLTIYNVLNIPAGVTYTINGPVSFQSSTIGDDGELIIDLT